MTSHRSHRVRPAQALFAGLLVIGSTTAATHAQWAIVNLHPAGASSSEALGVKNGQQVGYAGDSAIVWSGTAESAIILNPTPDQPAVAACVDGGAQGGRANVLDSSVSLYRMHAALWNGSAKSFIDLHPVGATNSQVTAMNAGTQVGVWFPPSKDPGFTLGRACLWHGTAESFVDLTPPSATFTEARGVYGDQQVGGNFDGFLPRACMWNGTPESYAELQQSSALFSIALCTNGVNQFGVAVTWDGEDFGTAHTEVGYWTGTPDSWVNITPKGLFGGGITAVDGSQQVGATAADAIGNPPFKAALWSSTAESYVDLHSFLPADYTESIANGIWHDEAGVTYVVGSALNTATNRTEAIMWVSGPTCAADFDNSGVVDSQDFFDFLVAFFGSLPSADFNHDTTVNSQDFFDFIAAFFVGC